MQNYFDGKVASILKSETRDLNLLHTISLYYFSASNAFKSLHIHDIYLLHNYQIIPLLKTVAPFFCHICLILRPSFINNQSYYSLISDAAASATAYACGVKTKNRRVGIDADGKYCGTLLEAAKKKGMRTAIVSSDVTFASSAAFASHVGDRGDVADIGTDRQLLKYFLNSLIFKII